MTQQQKNYLIAVVLGDGCINQRIINNTIQCRLLLKHSIKQKEYFDWKVKKLKEILDGTSKKQPNQKRFSKIVKEQHRVRPHQKIVTSVRYEKNHPYLKVLKRFVYRDKRKQYTPKVLNRLGLEGLAIQWMDDGSLYHFKVKNALDELYYSKCSGTWNTYITREENQVIVNWMTKKYGITPKIEKDKTFTRLRFNTGDMRKLVPLIEKYIHPSMRYKVELKVGQLVGDSALHSTSTAESEDIV